MASFSSQRPVFHLRSPHKARPYGQTKLPAFHPRKAYPAAAPNVPNIRTALHAQMQETHARRAAPPPSSTPRRRRPRSEGTDYPEAWEWQHMRYLGPPPRSRLAPPPLVGDQIYIDCPDATQPHVEALTALGPLEAEEQLMLQRIAKIRAAGLMRKAYHEQAAVVEEAMAEGAPEPARHTELRAAGVAKRRELRLRVEAEKERARRLKEKERKERERREKKELERRQWEELQERQRRAEAIQKAREEEARRQRVEQERLMREEAERLVREEAERRAEMERIREMHRRRVEEAQAQLRQEAEMRLRLAALERERERKRQEDYEIATQKIREAAWRSLEERQRAAREAEDAARRARAEQARAAQEAQDAARRAQEEQVRRERKAQEEQARRERQAQEEQAQREREVEERRTREEQERMQREALEKEIREFCALYEKKWLELKKNKTLDHIVSFREFPFPIFSYQPSDPAEITYARVREFFFHPCRGNIEGKTPKEILKIEVLRWHPDKFDHLIAPKVTEADWERTKEAAGLVARWVTQLMAEV